MAGATARAADRRGRTPLDLAIRLRAWPCVPPLLRANMRQLDCLDAGALLSSMIAGDDDQKATLALISLLAAHSSYRHPTSPPPSAPPPPVASAGPSRRPPPLPQVTLPLHMAVLRQRHRVVTAVVRWLGADPEAPFPGPYGQSPLQVAAEMGSCATTVALLRCGADPRRKDRRHWSALNAVAGAPRGGEAGRESERPRPPEFAPPATSAWWRWARRAPQWLLQRLVAASDAPGFPDKWLPDFRALLTPPAPPPPLGSARERDEVRYVMLKAAGLLPPPDEIKAAADGDSRQPRGQAPRPSQPRGGVGLATRMERAPLSPGRRPAGGFKLSRQARALLLRHKEEPEGPSFQELLEWTEGPKHPANSEASVVQLRRRSAQLRREAAASRPGVWGVERRERVLAAFHVVAADVKRRGQALSRAARDERPRVTDGWPGGGEVDDGHLPGQERRRRRPAAARLREGWDYFGRRCSQTPDLTIAPQVHRECW